VTESHTEVSAIATSEGLLAALSGASRVVFDLDGTLYDTRDFERPALKSVVDWLRERSGNPLQGFLQAIWFRRETSRHRPGLFDELLLKYGLPVDWGAECVQRFHDYRGAELTEADNLHDLLGVLCANGCRLALVSNGNAELQQRKLTLLGLRDMFDICIYCDPREPDHLKPSSWAWSQLATWQSSHSAVYVGDDPVDAEFALAGGVRFIPFRFRSPLYED
jgi:FMN phosphatase YigB (HAD superfamily)